MSNRKIIDLVPHNVDVTKWDELISVTEQNRFSRVNIGENTFETEEQAIERVKEIYRGKGMKAFILPYKQ